MPGKHRLIARARALTKTKRGSRKTPAPVEDSPEPKMEDSHRPPVEDYTLTQKPKKTVKIADAAAIIIPRYNAILLEEGASVNEGVVGEYSTAPAADIPHDRLAIEGTEGSSSLELFRAACSDHLIPLVKGYLTRYCLGFVRDAQGPPDTPFPAVVFQIDKGRLDSDGNLGGKRFQEMIADRLLHTLAGLLRGLNRERPRFAVIMADSCGKDWDVRCIRFLDGYVGSPGPPGDGEDEKSDDKSGEPEAGKNGGLAEDAENARSKGDADRESKGSENERWRDGDISGP